MSGKSVVFGPYEPVQAHEHAELAVHFSDNAATLVASTHSATFEITHWGNNIAVEEEYDIHHKGAKYDQSFFSRSLTIQVEGQF